MSIEPVTWYCKKLTVAGTQLSPSVSTGGRDTVVRQVQWSAAVQTRVNCHCQLEDYLMSVTLRFYYNEMHYSA